MKWTFKKSNTSVPRCVFISVFSVTGERKPCFSSTAALKHNYVARLKMDFKEETAVAPADVSSHPFSEGEQHKDMNTSTARLLCNTLT